MPASNGLWEAVIALVARFGPVPATLIVFAFVLIVTGLGSGPFATSNRSLSFGAVMLLSAFAWHYLSDVVGSDPNPEYTRDGLKSKHVLNWIALATGTAFGFLAGWLLWLVWRAA
jgi:hypothetical protein